MEMITTTSTVEGGKMEVVNEGIINPGDLHGRTLPAGTVELCWDGNLISALVGSDLVIGVSGFGETAHDALRDLADHLIEEAVWVEVPDRKSLRTIEMEPFGEGTIQANAVELYRVAEGRLCALLGSEDLSHGILGLGESVHEALRRLADELIAQGVWVEVTDRREWQFEELSSSEFPEGLKNTTGTVDAAHDQPLSRSLQVCRGTPLGQGQFSGCAYGSAKLKPLTGPCDCPVCNGSGYEGVTATWAPHCDFGDPECAGFLYGIVRGEQGYIECNDCDAVIRTMPAAALRVALSEMEASLEVATEKCPACGHVNLFPGFSQMEVYTCRECGKLIRLADGPDIDQIFGPANND